MNTKINGTSCQCGLMVAFVADYSMPFRHWDNQDNTVLVLHNGNFINFAYCHFCGGNEMGPAAKGIADCLCESLKHWSKDANIPIEYSKEFDRYYIAGNDSRADMYYCPKCGGRLPESATRMPFTEPSNGEIEVIKNKIRNARRMSDYLRILGEPDRVEGPTPADQQLKNVYGQRDIKQIYVYYSVVRTANLLIQEYDDGEIFVVFSGKPKDNQQL